MAGKRTKTSLKRTLAASRQRLPHGYKIVNRKRKTTKKRK
jgi:hypothetical protein